MTDVITWDRLEKETARAYRAFCVYRDMGAERSLSKVRDKLGKKSGYDRQLQEWSSQHRWVDRARAYDDHMEVLLRAEQERRIVTARRLLTERELNDFDLFLSRFDVLLEKATTQMSAPMEAVNGESLGEKIELAAADISVLLALRDRIARFGRRAVGMPATIAQDQHTGQNGSAIQVLWVDPLGEDDDIGIGADQLPDTP